MIGPFGPGPLLPPYLEEISAAFRTAPPLRPRGDPNRVLKCPVCSNDMVVEKLHGVRIDVCGSHGMWFDVGEVPTLIERVRAGESVAASRAVHKARLEGQMGPLLFGLWSLFLDRDG